VDLADLKAWNADFRGFGGFTRIFSDLFFKIRVNRLKEFAGFL